MVEFICFAWLPNIVSATIPESDEVDNFFQPIPAIPTHEFLSSLMLHNALIFAELFQVVAADLNFHLP
ncbi:MAG: hypothetical protein ACR2FN_05935 [Chitinophagaceae bacterium]